MTNIGFRAELPEGPFGTSGSCRCFVCPAKGGVDTVNTYVRFISGRHRVWPSGAGVILMADHQ
jgi:hypothetical protein